MTKIISISILILVCVSTISISLFNGIKSREYIGIRDELELSIKNYEDSLYDIDDSKQVYMVHSSGGDGRNDRGDLKWSREIRFDFVNDKSSELSKALCNNLTMRGAELERSIAIDSTEVATFSCVVVPSENFDSVAVNIEVEYKPWD